MTSLMVQIFAVVLGAFLLGVIVAWKLRLAAQRRRYESQATAVSTVAEPAPSESTMRFEKALAGSPVSESPPVSASGAPMIQVQPRRAPAAAAPAPAIAQAAPFQSRFGTPMSAPAGVNPAASPAPTFASPPPASAQPAAQSRFGAGPAPSAPAKPAAPQVPAAAPVSAQVPRPAPSPSPAPPEPPAFVRPPAATAPPTAAGAAPANPPPPTREIIGMPVAVAAAVAAATGAGTPASGDDLTRIRAIDVETSRRLRALGVTRFSDVARWTESDVIRMSQSLGFAGRIEAENWIEQARILVSGGQPLSASRAVGATSAAAPAPQEIRLHRIVGIDPATEKRLIDNGVTGVAEIARWMSSDIERIETLLGQTGRVGLENWIGQARVLLRGGSNVTELRPTAEAKPAQVQPPAEEKSAPAPAASAAVAPIPAPLPSPQPQGSGPRTEFAGLRSVRSEALRREPLRASASAAGQSDDLKRIRGVGVLIEKKLKSLGISSYEQIANWTRADIDRINGILDFKGRIERENWVEQARILTAGGYTEFSRRADRGEIETGRNRA